MKITSRSIRKNQKGAVLAISLIILLLMTIIGVSAMRSTTLQEKMAGNLRDYNVAFQAAEAALRDAETYIFGNSPYFLDSCTDGLCLPANPNNTPRWKMKNASNVSYWNDNTKYRSYGFGNTGVSNLPHVSRQPPTMIEELVVPSLDPSEPPSTRYRITAQGYGAAATTESDGTITPHARVMLQSVVKKT